MKAMYKTAPSVAPEPPIVMKELMKSPAKTWKPPATFEAMFAKTNAFVKLVMIVAPWIPKNQRK